MHLNLPYLLSTLENILNQEEIQTLDIFYFYQQVSKYTEHLMLVNDHSEWSDNPSLNLMMLGMFIQKNEAYGVWLRDYPEKFAMQECSLNLYQTRGYGPTAKTLLPHVDPDNIPLVTSILSMSFHGDLLELPLSAKMFGFLYATHNFVYDNNYRMSLPSTITKEEVITYQKEWEIIFELHNIPRNTQNQEDIILLYNIVLKQAYLAQYVNSEISLVI